VNDRWRAKPQCSNTRRGAHPQKDGEERLTPWISRGEGVPVKRTRTKEDRENADEGLSSKVSKAGQGTSETRFPKTHGGLRKFAVGDERKVRCTHKQTVEEFALD